MRLNKWDDNVQRSLCVWLPRRSLIIQAQDCRNNLRFHVARARCRSEFFHCFHERNALRCFAAIYQSSFFPEYIPFLTFRKIHHYAALLRGRTLRRIPTAHRTISPLSLGPVGHFDRLDGPLAPIRRGAQWSPFSTIPGGFLWFSWLTAPAFHSVHNWFLKV